MHCLNRSAGYRYLSSVSWSSDQSSSTCTPFTPIVSISSVKTPVTARVVYSKHGAALKADTP